MLDLSKLVKWFDDSFIDLIEMLIAALTVVAIGFVVAKLLKKVVVRILELKFNPIKLSESKRRTMKSLVLYVYDVVTYFIIAVIALGKLNMDVSSVLAVAGVGGIAVGFGAQSLIKDMMAGFLIFIEDQYEVGDEVTLAGIAGTVEELTLRITRVRTDEGDLVTITNGEIKVVTNRSRRIGKETSN